MPKGFKTINISDSVWEDLTTLAKRVAKKEGLTSLSMNQLIQRMKKVYEEQNPGLE